MVWEAGATSSSGLQFRRAAVPLSPAPMVLFVEGCVCIFELYIYMFYVRTGMFASRTSQELLERDDAGK